MSTEDCILDEYRFFDAGTKEWGYRIVCIHPDHREQTCPREREMFRWPEP